MGVRCGTANIPMPRRKAKLTERLEKGKQHNFLSLTLSYPSSVESAVAVNVMVCDPDPVQLIELHWSSSSTLVFRAPEVTYVSFICNHSARYRRFCSTAYFLKPPSQSVKYSGWKQ